MDHHRIDYHRQDAVLTHALSRFAEPFNHPDWILEIKWDGFRCLAFIENGCCRLVSRKGNEFKSFHALNIAYRRNPGPVVRYSMGKSSVSTRTEFHSSPNCCFAARAALVRIRFAVTEWRGSSVSAAYRSQAQAARHSPTIGRAPALL